MQHRKHCYTSSTCKGKSKRRDYADFTFKTSAYKVINIHVKTSPFCMWDYARTNSERTSKKKKKEISFLPKKYHLWSIVLKCNTLFTTQFATCADTAQTLCWNQFLITYRTTTLVETNGTTFPKYTVARELL